MKRTRSIDSIELSERVNFGNRLTKEISRPTGSNYPEKSTPEETDVESSVDRLFNVKLKSNSPKFSILEIAEEKNAIDWVHQIFPQWELRKELMERIQSTDSVE